MKKTVLITGASVGIGEATAYEFANAGWRVLLVARNRAVLEQVHKSLAGSGHAILACDITTTLCANKIEKALEKFCHGELDLLINNAGINHIGKLGGIDLQKVSQVFAVNTMAVIQVTQAALPSLKAAKGHIINVSSLMGLVGVPERSIYSASKAALDSLSQAWRLELKEHGVMVSVIRPAGVRTDFHERTDTDGKAPRSEINVKTPQEIAQKILILAKTRRRFMAPGLQNRLYQWLARHVSSFFEFGLYRRYLRHQKNK